MTIGWFVTGMFFYLLCGLFAVLIVDRIERFPDDDIGVVVTGMVLWPLIAAVGVGWLFVRGLYQLFLWARRRR